MNSLVKIASISLMFILFQGCEYFNTSTISPKQVKEQSLWSENDQAPSFSECDGLEGDANAECFKNMITERLTSILAEYNFTSDTILNEEVILTLEQLLKSLVLNLYYQKKIQPLLKNLLVQHNNSYRYHKKPRFLYQFQKIQFRILLF